MPIPLGLLQQSPGLKGHDRHHRKVSIWIYVDWDCRYLRLMLAGAPAFSCPAKRRPNLRPQAVRLLEVPEALADHRAARLPVEPAVLADQAEPGEEAPRRRLE